MPNKKTSLKKSTTDIASYNTLLEEVQSILNKGLSRAYQAVDNIKVQTYWQIGERIVREQINHKSRAEYGKQIISSLAKDLNYPESNFWRMVQFYRSYPILATVSRELSWSHYIELIKLENKDQKRFYEVQTIKNSWSIRDLRTKIKKDEYSKQKKAGKIDTALPSTLPTPQEIFKNTYDWNFIELEAKHSEKDLENALLDKIEKVLLELGSGFAFVGRQQKILIGGKWEWVDLLFYHITLKCYIVVELKARELERGDIEQVTRYLSYFRDNKVQGDRDPVALIICQRFNEIDVYYSAGKDRDDIFVAEYKTKLPKESEIKKRLKKSI